jgi:hypothetical protein
MVLRKLSAILYYQGKRTERAKSTFDSKQQSLKTSK